MNYDLNGRNSVILGFSEINWINKSFGGFFKKRRRIISNQTEIYLIFVKKLLISGIIEQNW